MNLEAKIQIYEKVTAAIAKGVKLELVLRERGEDAEADKVARKTAKLGEQAKKVRTKINEDWAGSAAAVKTNLKNLNKSLSAEIAKIKRTIDIAEKVVKAIGYIDDVIEQAAKLLA